MILDIPLGGLLAFGFCKSSVSWVSCSHKNLSSFPFMAVRLVRCHLCSTERFSLSIGGMSMSRVDSKNNDSKAICPLDTA